MSEIENLQRKFKGFFDEIGKEGVDEVLVRQPVQTLESLHTNVRFALDELKGEEEAWSQRGDYVSSIGRALGMAAGLAIGLQYKLHAVGGVARDIVYKIFEKTHGFEVLYNSEAIEKMNTMADEATRIPYGVLGLAAGAVAGAFSTAIAYYVLAGNPERRRDIRRLDGIYAKTEFLIKRMRKN